MNDEYDVIVLGTEMKDCLISGLLSKIGKISEKNEHKLNKVKSVGKVIRCICIMDHTVPKTNDVASCQIILPQRQINRKNDIFVATLSNAHSVCKKGYFLAIISTMVETEKPEDEIKPALDLLGPVLEKFVTVSDVYEPIDKAFTDNIYITSSFDPLSSMILMKLLNFMKN